MAAAKFMKDSCFTSRVREIFGRRLALTPALSPKERGAHFTALEGCRRASVALCGVGMLVFSLVLAAPAHAQTATTNRPQPAVQEAVKAPDTLAELRSRIGALVSAARYAQATWGVKIVSLDTGALLYEVNPGKLLSPASNSKLYTMAMALDRLGPDYRIKTSLYSRAKPDADGTLAGDLIVFGRGDPCINARLNGGDVFKALEPLVAALAKAGVKRITGEVVGDCSYFRGPPYGPGWDWQDLDSYYGAEVSALTVNDNYLQLRVTPGASAGAPCKIAVSPDVPYLVVSNRTQTVAKGGRRSIKLYRPLGENVVYVSGQVAADDATATDEDMTVHKPAAWFAALFKEALARRGIQVTGKATSMDWNDREAEPLDFKQLVELGFMESPPMRDILREVMKPSQNLYTDMILEHVGAKAGEAAGEESGRTMNAGVRELNKFLGEAGVKRGWTIFDEGSGLSRDNVTTPEATVALLTFMAHHRNFDVYKDSLPIAGVDGTLRRRMKGTPAEGNLRGKTGTLRWANSLSGYVTTAAGEHLAFSLMLNRYQAAGSKTTDLDVIGGMLAGFTGSTK